MAEVHYSQTGYHYVLNSPLAFTDPLGLDTIDVNNFRIKDYKEDVDVVALSEATVTGKKSSNNGFAALSFLDASDDPYFKKRPYDVVEYRRTLNAARDPAIDLMNVASVASGIGDAYLLTRGGIMILKGGIPLILKRLALKKALKEGSQLLLSPGKANLTQQGLEHIVARHWFTSGAKGAGKFLEGTTARSLKDMIGIATTKGVFRSNTYGRMGTIAEYNFGNVIGTTSKGLPASNLRVIISPNGNVISAFPF